MLELIEAAVEVGTELNADYFIQFMRKGFINIMTRRYGFNFHPSSRVLKENGNEFIPVLVDVKDAKEKFQKLQSKVERTQ
ncbi:hypothetical protein bcgnr5372_37420 [Bacillus luti]|nr:hypothetical protein [Bacillus cereus]HDR8330032.1 hypothetical protein [Bacillus cereus]HDR8337254.1 hypothetical protein [Bacillus cereus]